MYCFLYHKKSKGLRLRRLIKQARTITLQLIPFIGNSPDYSENRYN